MLTEIAEGVLTRQSEFCQSNAVVVLGPSGALLIDPGVLDEEMAALADELSELGQPVVAGFATHPHWDHLLWHPRFGAAPRYGTARCADASHAELSDPQWRANAAEGIPPDIVDRVPLDLLGLVTGLPAGATRIPWDGPNVRIIEHPAHAPGHAALLVEDRGVLVAGDMLSDILIPLLDLGGSANPAAGYLAGLDVLADAADDVTVIVPGHGSAGDAGQLRTRIEQDRQYVRGLDNPGGPADERMGPGTFGEDWLPAVHEWQVEQLAQLR